MAGLANGWNINELHRGFGQLFVGLALPADGAVMAIDFPSGNPDATANPNGFSVGYTSEGWEFTIEYTSEERRVNEEETPVADFITETTARITGTMAQVRNLDLLSFMLPGSVYSAPAGTPTQIEKLTGGGGSTFSYFTAALIWPDDDDADVKWWIMLYRCLNTGGLTLGISRTADSLAPVTLSGRAVSGRTAGDRVYALVRAEDVTP